MYSTKRTNKYILMGMGLGWLSVNCLLFPKIVLGQNSQRSFPTLPPPPPSNTINNNQNIPSSIPSGVFNNYDNFIPPRKNEPPIYQDNALSPLNTYYLDQGDGITINVDRFPDFNTVGVIDSEGNMVIPVVGRINFKGLTLKEAEVKVSNYLGSKYLQKNPKVNVILTSPRPVKLTIVGEVSRPGFYNLATGSPIDQVLLAAGGSTKNADLRSIIIRRELPNKQIIERKIDIFTPLQTGNNLPNVYLQGGDTIIISKLELGNDQGYNRELIAKTSLVQQTIKVRFWNEAAGGITILNVPNGSTVLDVLGNIASTNQQLTDTRNIALLRYDPQKGGIIKQAIDGKRAIQGDIAQNVPLQDEDVIIVGRTLLGKVINALGLVTQPFQSLFSFVAFINTLENLFN